jgi:hypothetical protein
MREKKKKKKKIKAVSDTVHEPGLSVLGPRQNAVKLELGTRQGLD